MYVIAPQLSSVLGVAEGLFVFAEGRARGLSRGRGCLLGVIFFIVVLAFLLRPPGLVDKGIESTDLMCAVESFARYYGRMPESFEELVESGYLRPAIVNGERVYQWCLSRDDEALPPAKSRQGWVSPVKIHYPLK